MTVLGSYQNGFAPRDGQPLYPELWRGCVGAWAPCLGPTGLTLRDWSVFRNHATLTNMVPDSDWVPGAGQYSLDFDGTNDHVVVPSSSLFATSGGANWSISGWAFIKSTAAVQTVVCRGQNAMAQRDYILYYNGGANARFELQNSNGAIFPTITTATGSVAQNTWYHVAGTCDVSGNAVLYLNGFSKATGSLRTDVTTNNNRSVTFGAAFDAPTTQYYLNGLLDDLRVYNRVITAAEVKTLAARRGIAYELAPRKVSRIFTGGFRAYWATRKAQIIGGGL